MISPEEALQTIIENTPVLSVEQATLAEAVGRVLAENLYAREDLPSFDNSAMDGYAVKVSNEVKTPELRVREVVRAGTLSGPPLGPGEAVKIMTGAPVPEGTEAVVMWEWTETTGEGRVRIRRTPKPGANIRRKGEDVLTGDLLLNKGALIRPYEVGLLAAQGFEKVPVTRQPKVAVISTGDELVGIGVKPGPGQIRSSNGPALAASLMRWGILPSLYGPVKDDPAILKLAFESELRHADMLLICGGVSSGDFDFTKEILEEMGMKVIFWKVAIKPGKPLLFGLLGDKVIFGLPGNPVAVLVCTEEFVRPALEKMRGVEDRHPSYHLEGVMENDYPKDEERQQFLFCRASETAEGFRLHIIRPQGSAMMGMAAKANALALGPIGIRRIEKGMRVKFRWLK